MFPNATKAEKVKKNLKQFKNIPESEIVSFSEDTAQKTAEFQRHGIQHGDTVSSFTEDTAQKTGESQRHIQRLIQIAESLPEDVKETVKKIDLLPNPFPYLKPQNNREKFSNLLYNPFKIK